MENDDSVVYHISIFEFSLMIMLFLFLFIFVLLNNSIDNNSFFVVKIPQKEYDSILNQYSNIQDENKILKEQIAKLENKTIEYQNMIDDYEQKVLQYSYLLNELNKAQEQLKENEQKYERQNKLLTLIWEDFNTLEAEYEAYKLKISDDQKKYGKLSDIPPDCSKTDLIDSFLFEAALVDENNIKINDKVIMIKEIEYIYKNELKQAKENNCIHKIKLFIPNDMKSSVSINGEKNLQKYFYVVKVIK